MKTSIIKLKPIPNNTVVHTPTEEEAKELLEILHENRYTWRAKSAPLYDTNWHVFYSQTVYFIHSDDKTISAGNMSDLSTLTLAEFKERFLIEEDKPQPKFKVGDSVAIRWINKGGTIINVHYSEEAEEWEYNIKVNPKGLATALENNIKPYIEPETKPTENMEAKDEKSGIPINLCELLKGHEGEPFYSPCYGVVELTAITPRIEIQGVKKHSLTPKGSHHSISDGQCMLFPSRALYEQYPLDAKKAWEVWQEEQKIKCRIWLSVETKATGKVDVKGWEPAFDSTADRDKAIEEIKAIIEKYNKK